MARVVQRRTPPYLLIVFVILFVFATVMAVLFFNKYNGVQKRYAQTLLLRKQLANNEQLKQPEIRQMVNQYKKSTVAGIPTTVVAQLRSQIFEMTNAITGMPNISYLEAKQEVARTFKAINPPVQRGLVKHMMDFHEQLGVKDAEIAKLKGERTQSTTQLGAANQALTAAKDGFAAKLKEKDEQTAALDQKFQNLEAENKKELAKAKEEYDASAAAAKGLTAEQANKTKAVEEEARKWEKKYKKEVGKKIRPAVDTSRTVRKPDGKVIRVLADDNLVYINIGSKSRVTEDLRLTVYPYTGIPDSGAGKAVIQVTNIRENVSECRILEQKKDNPILPGDLVANLVFDALRTYSFVVEGRFDLEGTGAPTMAGNKAIQGLVRRYGGRLLKEVSVDCDYVILGDSPARPQKPDDTDPQDAWSLFEERQKAYNRYMDVVRKAEGMQIPRLGGKRFLDLIGYIPTKVAKSE